MCQNVRMKSMMRSSLLPLVVLCLCLTAPRSRGEEEKKPTDAPKISVEEFDKMREKPDAVVLDVRSAEEFAAGHVPGAVNLPINDPQFKKKVDGLDKEKTYLVH